MENVLDIYNNYSKVELSKLLNNQVKSNVKLESEKDKLESEKDRLDSKSKFVNKYVVTDASVHDSQALEEMLDEKDKGQKLYADSAYTGENQEKTIAKHEMDNQVHELRSTQEYLQKKQTEMRKKDIEIVL